MKALLHYGFLMYSFESILTCCLFFLPLASSRDDSVVSAVFFNEIVSSLISYCCYYFLEAFVLKNLSGLSIYSRSLIILVMDESIDFTSAYYEVSFFLL